MEQLLEFGTMRDDHDGRPLVDCEGGPKPEFAEDADLPALVQNQLDSIGRSGTRLWVGEQEEGAWPLVDDQGALVAIAHEEDLAYRVAAATQADRERP